MDAGFTIDQLATAEQVLDTGKASLPRDLLLPRAIVESLIKRKLVGEPWQGPLPAPRVSPPRTLGDFLAKASHRDLGTRGGSGKSPRHPRSPTRTISARSQEDSKFFEKTKIQDHDTLFHPLPRSTLWTEATVACARIGAEGGTVRAFSGCAERVQIGSGKFFRPTKGLCALFRRTGTRRSPIVTKPPPVAYTTPSRPWFADVVRAGKQMAAQGSGHGGDHGARGGGRGAGYNPGFHPGFDPGHGWGHGRDQFPPRGRGRGQGYGGFGYFNQGFGGGRGGSP